MLFWVSSRSNLARSLSNDDFLIEDIFSPPFIIGQVIVALTDSSSFLSIAELKSLFSDFPIPKNLLSQILVKLSEII